MLDQFPRLSHLWDRKDRSFKEELFERELGVLSSCEIVTAQFFASVLFGSFSFGIAYMINLKRSQE